jgi:pimeloyl-ACP methyl ester carboxylesterase
MRPAGAAPAIRHPELVRKLVIAASAHDPDGVYPQVLENIRKLNPEDFEDSPWLDAYASVAPNPEGWPTLLGKVLELVGEFEGWPPEAVRAIEAPALVIVADSDIVRPEHAVELFRLLGGGVAGDVAGLPRSQLARWSPSFSTRPCRKPSDRLGHRTEPA